MSRAVNTRFEILDVRDHSAVAEYESAFHASFARVTDNRLIRDLWVWNDDAQRLAVRIPYDDQVVYVARDAKRGVRTALGVNVAMRTKQSSAFGFGDGIGTGGCCELLTYFTTGDHRVGAQRAFIEACFTDLRGRGLHTAYATTAPRPLPTYRRIGGELLDERRVEGEMRYFLKFSLSRAWMRR
jgi:hypothetical protein